jgi:hypothetical protein
MVRYGRGVFRVGKGARGIALVVGLSCALLSFGVPIAGAVRSRGTAVVPADGRLNTPDFMAKVTSVAWPATNAGQEPTPGRRFVTFTLKVAALTESVSPTSQAATLSAALRWDGTTHPLSLSSILGEIQSGAGASSTPSASASFMATVPNNTHDVDLVFSEDTFSQSFDLWTLRRVPPSPAVLYRDPTQTTITGNAAAPAMLALSNPSDGFASSATVTLQSATLGFTGPSGTTLAPSPDQAVLSVVLDAEHHNDPNDPTGSGHYLGSSAPLPASMLSFTPSGASAAPATVSDAGDTNRKGSSDDGLFDATYSFLVPATLTSGTLQIAAGSFTGAEFTLYTAESGTTTLDVAAPANLALTFPAPVAAITQSAPPWVGQPDPPTAAASSASTSRGPASAPSHGFPLWVAIVVLLALAGGAVLIERWRRTRRLAPASAPQAEPTALVQGGPKDPRAGVAGPETGGTSRGDAAVGAQPADQGHMPAAVVAEGDVVGSPAGGEVALNVLGTREILGLEIDASWALLLELFTYLVFHTHRHLRAAQIAIGLRPGGSKELDEKTVRNAIARLRRDVGSKRLPEAGTEGYLIDGVGSDWFAFEHLSRQAETTGGEEAIALRQAALALVRGAPFADVNDEWIDAERLRSHMVVTIVNCAVRLATDLLDSQRALQAEEAASAGLRGATRHYVLWELGAWAICDQVDRGRLKLWMADAKAALDEDDYARLERSVDDHLGPSAS